MTGWVAGGYTLTSLEYQAQTARGEGPPYPADDPPEARLGIVSGHGNARLALVREVKPRSA